MSRLVDKYAAKMVSAGLADPGAPLIGELDADLVWNRDDPMCGELEKVFRRLNINALLFSRPAEPYRSIIDYMARNHTDAIYPEDCETRTFLHDLPVIDDFNTARIVEKLKQRKSVIIKGHGIITYGTVSPEQTYIYFSSVCFAGFVKFFSDYLAACRKGIVTREQQAVFNGAKNHLDAFQENTPALLKGPFHSGTEVRRAICEAGRATVGNRLVDSFFGNISFKLDNTLYISQTGSSLDELESCIDPCPLDEMTCASITASSEFTAHREMILRSGINGILHGHPKFSVIMSMDCVKKDCALRGQCHIRCDEKRTVCGVPIVPGEVGTGPHGLCNTLPPAVADHGAAIVYGHGLFTVAGTDFNDAFKSMLDIERTCREEYFLRIGQVSK